MSTKTRLAERRRERNPISDRTLGALSPRSERVLAAVEADRSREPERTAALIAAARRRLAAQPIPLRAAIEPEEAA